MSKNFGSFKFLTGDVNFADYGGKWCRKVGERRYHVIELLNWEETVGEREASEIGATYNVSLSEIDLDQIDTSDALKSCGWYLDSDGLLFSEAGDQIADLETQDLAIVDACHGYGCKAPLSDESGNSYRALIANARKLSRSLDAPEKRAVALAKPVNALGSTALEYMRGDIDSAIDRGMSAGDPKALLMGRLYGKI